jgi:hypothetical protein
MIKYNNTIIIRQGSVTPNVSSCETKQLVDQSTLRYPRIKVVLGDSSQAYALLVFERMIQYAHV